MNLSQQNNKIMYMIDRMNEELNIKLDELKGMIDDINKQIENLALDLDNIERE